MEDAEWALRGGEAGGFGVVVVDGLSVWCCAVYYCGELSDFVPILYDGGCA